MTDPGHQVELSIGQCATLACLLEATIPKPGNVHRGADFEDVTLYDFMASAVAIGPAIDSTLHNGVGPAILDAIRATRRLTRTNTNLGTVLLLAPLAAVPRETPLRIGVQDVLTGLERAVDANAIYEAIRLAQPGGLGNVSEMDVADSPPENILHAMRAAADRDLVARQYVNGFKQVLDMVVPSLIATIQNGASLATAVIHAHVELMAAFPDSLIARKCGREAAATSARVAANVLAAGEPGSEDYARAIADLDFWLRSDGHRRNPGTTADLIAAGMFSAIREKAIEPPFRL